MSDLPQEHAVPDLGLDEQGEEAFLAAAEALSPDELAAPSLLPGWSRAHVAAHVAGNAAAFARAVSSGAGGEPAPMYSSREARDADIERLAGLERQELLDTLRADISSLREAWAALTPEQWDLGFLNGRGDTAPIRSSVAARAREIWVHLVDLDAPGVGGFGAVPAQETEAVLREVFGMWSARGQAAGWAIATQASDGAALTLGAAEDAGTTVVTGPLALVTAWATGRLRDGEAGPDATRDGAAVDPGPAPTWV